MLYLATESINETVVLLLPPFSEMLPTDASSQQLSWKPTKPSYSTKTEPPRKTVEPLDSVDRLSDRYKQCAEIRNLYALACWLLTLLTKIPMSEPLRAPSKCGELHVIGLSSIRYRRYRLVWVGFDSVSADWALCSHSKDRRTNLVDTRYSKPAWGSNRYTAGRPCW